MALRLQMQGGGAPPTEVGGTKAPVSAKPAEAHPPALIMLAINAAIRRITNTASEDTFPHLSAVILADDSSANWSWRLSAKAGK